MLELFSEKFSTFYGESFLSNFSNLYIYINGKFLLGKNAVISVWDHGLLYGDGVFEGIREYSGNIFKLDEHIDRLYRSASCLDISIPLTKEEFKEIIYKTCEINNLKNVRIRVIVTRGAGDIKMNPKNVSTSPSVIVLAVPSNESNDVQRKLKLIITWIRRRSFTVIDSKIKTLNYINNILAKIEANRQGADDAIMLDEFGYIAEATGANIFYIKDEIAYTPLTTQCLEGITRKTVMEIVKDIGYLPVVEKNITSYDIYTADEVLICGSTAEILPVCMVDGKKIRNGEVGKITKQIIDSYFKKVNKY